MAIARPARLLKNRHGVYCFRWVVPAGLRDDTGHPRDVRVSLGARDPKPARALGLQINLTSEGFPLATKPQDFLRLVERLAQQAARSDTVANAVAAGPAYDTTRPSLPPPPALCLADRHAVAAPRGRKAHSSPSHRRLGLTRRLGTQPRLNKGALADRKVIKAIGTLKGLRDGASAARRHAG